jgi:hypothetical protein
VQPVRPTSTRPCHRSEFMARDYVSPSLLPPLSLILSALISLSSMSSVVSEALLILDELLNYAESSYEHAVLLQAQEDARLNSSLPRQGARSTSDSPNKTTGTAANTAPSSSRSLSRHLVRDGARSANFRRDSRIPYTPPPPRRAHTRSHSRYWPQASPTRNRR